MLARVSESGILQIPQQALRALVGSIFQRRGMSEAHAALTADVLVWADLRGMGSHGVMRVPQYVRLIGKGDLNPRPRTRTLNETPGAIVLDADRAAGPIAMSHAARAACDKAKGMGIGLALVKDTTHTAALGYYTQSAAREGYAAIALAASSPLMAYHGARAAGVSTAPLSIAVPGEDEPFALDMASSMISMGALAQARRSGQALPEGVALAADGTPTTDPQAASIPLPLGGAKGSGLAFMAECLASFLTANPILAEALEQTPDSKRHRQNGLVIAIDIARFAPLSFFKKEIERLAADLRKLPGDDILMPGERGSRSAALQRDAVVISPQVYQELETLKNSVPGT
ncbi:MAG TPA: Ldh family oxidoreductase [Burkholderiales bacterium]|nr:Ldh family oxidoreductase [Burkholderiales bacterium]